MSTTAAASFIGSSWAGPLSPQPLSAARLVSSTKDVMVREIVIAVLPIRAGVALSDIEPDASVTHAQTAEPLGSAEPLSRRRDEN
jgi:hypothetical protein